LLHVTIDREHAAVKQPQRGHFHLKNSLIQALDDAGAG